MDNLTKEQRRKNMQNIRSVGTLPERIIMSELKRKKIYFARNVSGIVGKPDIVFRRKRVVVFIDSDFWHGNPKRFQAPQTNESYWQEKIKRNKERDRDVNRILRMQGWAVLRFWAHDVVHNKEKVINKIISRLETANYTN